MTSKRKRQDEDGEKENEGSPRQKRTRFGQADLVKGKERGTPTSAMKAPKTPSKRPRGRPRGNGKKPGSLVGAVEPQSAQDTPKSKLKGKVLFETPTKPREGATDASVPLVRNADRSARRKSARTVIKQTIADDLSEDNELDEDDLLARQIWDAAEAEDGILQNEVGNEFAGESTAPNTPSEPGRRQRKGARRKKTPTPPQDLPAHEQYFFQNRPGNTKTSNNTLSSLSLLTHEQYHDQVSAYVDPHESSIAYLHSLHSRSFPQWRFELSQSFNVCLYGYGSKRQLITSFASYLHEISPSSPPQIMIVNGYTSTLTLRQILTTLATLVFSCTPSTLPSHLSTQSQSMISAILAHQHSSPASPPIRLFINSLDAPLLRRAPNPALLAQLAASPQIHLVATCDTPSFPLLWDSSLREQYKWLFHDTTTFRSYAPIEVGNVINDVNELLGRSGRSVKGREGVGFVLRSLPENARNLYRLLIAELLAIMDSDANGLNDDLGDDELEDLNENLGRSSRKGRRSEASVEYAVLRQKVEEEFICSSEMAFRQLLKEFYDHQMVVSRRDGAGTEMLGVPFRRVEIEAILEDLLDE
jgi:origin recognition complex subunit 2